MTEKGMDQGRKELDQLILTRFPYPIAVNYREMLNDSRVERKVRRAVRVFDFLLRALAAGLISQYKSTVAVVNDPHLNTLLSGRLREATLSTWRDVLFATLDIYRGHRDLFFMPEIYDLYWIEDQSSADLRPLFEKLLHIRNEVIYGQVPQSEAEWQALYEEILPFLQDLLKRLSFLQHYELIRITEALEDGKYRYQVYTGLKIQRNDELLRSRELLETDHIYLTREYQRFLELHPLVLSLEEKDDPIRDGQEVVLYDRYLVSYLDYLPTRHYDEEPIPVDSRRVLGDFLLLLSSFEQKLGRRKAGGLDWGLLRRVVARLSRDRMGEVWSRYQANVYLQRDLLQEVWTDFLSSEPTCLVLLGHSGVGKSSFVLSLAEAQAQDEQVAVLLYDGARLRAGDRLEDLLREDITRYLELEGLEWQGGTDILLEINRIPGMEENHLVLIIDGLNENLEARQLLRQIDQLVERTPYRWLKVVVTCRPETWRTIRQGTFLAQQRYYRAREREKGGREGVEEEPVVELLPFTGEEVPRVYGKYQQAYAVQTSWAELPGEVRELVRDPLALWLVARSYLGRSIPPGLRASELYPGYIKALIQSGRLRGKDVEFLEQELMPLMLRPGHYANEITGDEIARAQTRGGQDLFELIHEGERLSTGEQVNQAYINLVNAGILVEQQKTTRGYALAFRYERFYEYHAGRRLREMAQESSDQAEAYQEWIGKIKDSPFLWGAIRSALVEEARTGVGRALLKRLARTTEQGVKEMAVVVLTEWGRESREEVRGLLEELLGLRGHKRSASLKRLAREERMRERNARKAAVEVASGLRMPELLVLGGIDRDGGVRSHAIKQSHYLWRQSRADALRVLDGLCSRLRGRWGLPDTTAIESFMGLSFLLYFKYYRDKGVENQLRLLAQRAIEQVLYVSRGGRKNELVRGWLRRIVVSAALHTAVGITHERQTSGRRFIGDASFLKPFFSLSPQYRTAFQELLAFLTPQPSLGGLRRALYSAIPSGDMLTSFTMVMALATQGAAKPAETLALIEELGSWIAVEMPRNVHGGQLLWAAYEIIAANETLPIPETVALFRRLLSNWVQTSRGYYHGDDLFQSFCDMHMVIAYRKLGLIDIDSVRSLYFAPIFTEQEKRTFAEELLNSAVRTLAVHRGYIHLSLAVFETVEKSLPQFNPALSLDTLAMLRAYYPQEVDGYIESQEYPKDLKERLWSTEFRESIFADQIGPDSGTFLAIAPTIRPAIVDALGKAMKYHSFATWVTYCARTAVNLIYGERII